MRLRFDVLGPFAIRRGPTAVPLPAGKHRMVLAMLLANANRVVSAEELIDELWPGDPPRTSRKTLQGYVWRIRQALALPDTTLVTANPGYQLVVKGHDLDVLEFERLSAAALSAWSSGRKHECVGLLAEAVRLWRGPAFGGVPGSFTVRAHAARLDETMLCSYERLIAMRLELGQSTQVLPDLTGVANRHPLRESVHRLLMRALYDNGRPLDALKVYASLRDALAVDYGLDPHSDTTQLHEAILRGLPMERVRL